jgi:hypothetical protein
LETGTPIFIDFASGSPAAAIAAREQYYDPLAVSLTLIAKHR